MKKQLFAILTAALLAACSSDGGSGNGIDPNNINANPAEKTHATRYEVPALNEEDIFLTYTTTEAGRQQVTYSLSYDTERKHTRWVAFTFESNNRAIKWNRDNWDGDPWDYTPEISTEDQMDSSRGLGRTYGLNGYDRGHLVASYDRLYSKEANRQTFYSVNMSPMLSRFNQDGPWNKLETKINNRSSGWCATNDVLYVVKGATIREGEYNIKSTLTIPKYYYMALVRQKDGRYHGIAFLMEHKNYLPGTIADYAISIDKLEEFTGIDFFCNLPDKLEKVLESSCDKNAWNL